MFLINNKTNLDYHSNSSCKSSSLTSSTMSMIITIFIIIIIIITTISFNSFNHLRNRIDHLEQKYSLLESTIINNNNYHSSSSSSSSNKPELIKSSNLPDETFDQLLTDIIDEWQLYNNNNKRQNNDFIISSNSYDDVNVSDHNSINVDNDDDDLKPNMKKFHNRFEQLIQMKIFHASAIDN
ncbi:hypothetical protein DERP_003859 [Dermatophagoides pteronyssinus]|uniref:Uncharacterized protein n=1 Tax=Dermatophagoides pteronyssinus TaxID=6956 RepID=A0ABQ8J7F9_DERPT|nr:hypothetical protein DERP_003859 [Dermatophagoides pteronyssinus]